MHWSRGNETLRCMHAACTAAARSPEYNNLRVRAREPPLHVGIRSVLCFRYAGPTLLLEILHVHAGRQNQSGSCGIAGTCRGRLAAAAHATGTPGRGTWSRARVSQSMACFHVVQSQEHAPPPSVALPPARRKPRTPHLQATRGLQQQL
jgi:hypothetical protein